MIQFLLSLNLCLFFAGYPTIAMMSFWETMMYMVLISFLLPAFLFTVSTHAIRVLILV